METGLTGTSVSVIAALSTVRCGDLHGNSNPQTLDSSLRGAAFSSSRVLRPGKPEVIVKQELTSGARLPIQLPFRFFLEATHAVSSCAYT